MVISNDLANCRDDMLQQYYLKRLHAAGCGTEEKSRIMKNQTNRMERIKK